MQGTRKCTFPHLMWRNRPQPMMLMRMITGWRYTSDVRILVQPVTGLNTENSQPDQLPDPLYFILKKCLIMDYLVYSFFLLFFTCLLLISWLIKVIISVVGRWIYRMFNKIPSSLLLHGRHKSFSVSGETETTEQIKFMVYIL